MTKQMIAIGAMAGIRPDDPLLVELKSDADFPKDDKWIDATPKRILKSQTSAN